MKFLVTAFLLCLSLHINPAYAFECKECHSKNPKMVTMHKAFEGRNCFDCHNIGEKLMGKGKPKDLDSLLKRRTTDSSCIECHRR